MGKRVLINKASPQNTSHHLTLGEAVRLMKCARDLRAMHALADEARGVFVPLPEARQPGTEAVVSDISRMSPEFSSLMKEVAAEKADGEPTPEEFRRVQREVSDLRAALAKLMADLMAMLPTSWRPVVAMRHII